MNQELDRRDFMRKGAQATAAAAAAVLGTNTVQGAGPDDKKIIFTDALPVRELGKTKVELPVLGYGGAAVPKKFGNTLSDADRVKLVRHAYDSGIRYFDTAISISYDDSQTIIGEALKDVRDNVFITTKVDFWDTSKPDGRITKVDKAEVARQVQKNLAELKSDHVDAILIHGTPGVEQMTVEQCMEVHGELVKARDKGLVRFVGIRTAIQRYISLPSSLTRISCSCYWRTVPPLTSRTGAGKHHWMWSPPLEGIYRSIGDLIGIELDLARIKRTRPQIAELLREKAETDSNKRSDAAALPGASIPNANSAEWVRTYHVQLIARWPPAEKPLMPMLCGSRLNSLACSRRMRIARLPSA